MSSSQPKPTASASRQGRSPAPDSTRMVLLGLLARYGPKHGYELRVLIEQQHLDGISDVQYGSIYAGLKRLARDGFVAEADRSREGNRPERVAYDVTDAGRDELRRLIRRGFLDPVQPERPVDLAVHFSGLLPLDDVKALVQARLDALDAFARHIEATTAATEHDHPGVRALIEDIPAHFREISKAERRWTERVLKRLEAGGYPTPGRTLDD